jgi:hypothetical protein
MTERWLRKSVGLGIVFLAVGLGVVSRAGQPAGEPAFPLADNFEYQVRGGLPNGDHTVTVTIAPDPADKAKILSRNGLKIDDPGKYEGTAFYPGGLMIVGDLVLVAPN